MKPFLAVLAGFITTSMIFVSGGAVAMYLFITKPAEHFDPTGKVAALWSPTPTDATGEPRPQRVVRAKSTILDSSGGEVPVADASAAPSARIDMASTAGIADTTTPKTGQENSALSNAHVAWCEQNYRSYRRETNSFTPYGGGSKPCISPYSNERMGGSSGSEENAQYASNDVAGLSDAHINDCMNRYRSYRVSDNTFQPYGGGPRQQCR
ncbi:MAG: hypothetical protein CL534_02655 [Ahrensia sp.]|nr:hypothetical protein [Ahrensia sp.]